jgi:SepF-like predicted cell division protein (DUF552 family)
MKNFFSKIMDKFSSHDEKEDDFEKEGVERDYVELDNVKSNDGKSKIIVRPYTIEDFSDIKPILDAMREGYTIAIVNIRPLKEKDIVELKRAVSKLKKTCDAIEGEIAGFDEDYVIITPSFATISRTKGGISVGSGAQQSKNASVESYDDDM